MTLFRCFPWNRAVSARVRGGALWFPRILQGGGRHDNPTLYGCLYVAEKPVSAVVEHFAHLRGTTLEAADLAAAGLPLSLAAIDLGEGVDLVDLDDPRVLSREDLRPSLIATGKRSRTQGQAAELFRRHGAAAGLRWWSTFESQWANVTLFDRAAPSLEAGEPRPLSLEDDVTGEAARFLGLRLAA